MTRSHALFARPSAHSPRTKHRHHHSRLEKLETRTMLSMVMGDGSAGCGCAACQAASKALSDVSPLQPNEIVVSQLARTQSSAAGDGIWQPLSQLPAARAGQVSHLPLRRYAPFTIDARQLKATLAQAPKEFTSAARNPLVFSMPTPVGTYQKFQVLETTVMAPALAARFPQIKTYVARGIDDPTATARLDVNPFTGFHAMVLSSSGTWAIDNYFHNDKTAFVSYFKSDINRVDNFRCLTVPTQNDAPVFPGAGSEGGAENIPAGNVLRTFRLAVTTTTGYNSFHGNTIASVLSAVTTTVNRMTGVYERDLSTRLELVANTTLLFSGLDGNPVISGGTNVSTLANNNQAFTDSRIGFSSYDVGHVFSSGPNNGVSAGGIGIVGSAAKARACSQTSPPSGDLFSIDYVSHEVGHQFNGRHNFSNCSGGPGDSGSIANEPGSGATIMGYAGLCGSNNLQSNSDAMFNHINYNQMYPYVLNTIPGVGTTTPTGNGIPTVSAGSNYVIPTRTPYVLTAVGSDPDDDPLTYSWEGVDTGGSLPVNNTTGTTGPVVRTWLPASSPSRTIPRPQSLLNNTTATGEVLTQVARTMNFRVVVRDGRGGVNFSDMSITTVNVGTSGFFISNHNTLGLSYNGGSSIEVAWNVANTNLAPINTSNVNIKLSLDGGFTFPITLANATANDGSEFVQLPYNTGSTQARLRVEAVGNIFFDVNNFNFNLVNVPDILAPGQPLLAPGSDSGISNSDGITNFDNSTPAKALQFSVPGTTAGDTVAILIDGVEVGSAIATGSTTTVITNGTTPLANGVRNVTARRTPSGGGSASPDSPVLQITIDTIAPQLVSQPSFQFATAPHRLLYSFSENVGPTLGTDDLAVTQMPSTTVTTSLSYNGGTNQATFTFPGFANGVVADGDYNALLSAAGITDIAGNPLNFDSNLNFFFLLGDINHDRFANLLDFNILVGNFGASGNYLQGDLDYNGIVDLNDFNIFATRFGLSLAAPDSLGRTASPSPFGGTRISDDTIDDLLELSA